MPPQRRGPGPSEPDAIRQARQRTRDQLGAAAEAKATDDFCLAFAGTMPAALEAFLVSGTGFAPGLGMSGFRTTAVIEFAPSPPESEASSAERVTRAVGALEAVDPEAGFTVVRAVQHEQLARAREAFLIRAGVLRDDIERATSAVLRDASGRVHTAEEERLLVEVCWLNETMRTVDARAIGNAVADPAVERVDVPRPLERDKGGEPGAEGAISLGPLRVPASAGGLAGRGVKVAVIDSECALDHPAFEGRVIHRRNFTKEPWGTPDAHGTAVAGIIAAGGDTPGLAPEATIYNYKVLGSVGGFNATDFQGTQAIQQALEDGVRLANCSWGAGRAGDGSSREARACDRAWQFGLAVVKSAGNTGPGQGSISTPADADGVIVVGATDSSGRSVARYSSSGPTTDGRARPHLVAPGGGRGDELNGLLPGGGTGAIGYGTSFAAPHVSGLLALMLEAEPLLTPGQLRDRLLAACRRLAHGDENRQGAGLPDLERLFVRA